MIKDNRGLTLVELLVAVAIMGLIMVSLSMLLGIGSRTYSRVHNDLNLQMEMQVALLQMQERLIDCNGGLAWDGQILTITNINDDDPEAIFIEQHGYQVVDNILYYGYLEQTLKAAVAISEADIIDIMAADVNNIDLNIIIASDNRTDLVEFGIEVEAQNDVHTAQQSLALRNQPLFAVNSSGLLAMIEETLE